MNARVTVCMHVPVYVSKSLFCPSSVCWDDSCVRSLAPFKANIYVSAVLVDAVVPSCELDQAVNDALLLQMTL